MAAQFPVSSSVLNKEGLRRTVWRDQSRICFLKRPYALPIHRVKVLSGMAKSMGVWPCALGESEDIVVIDDGGSGVEHNESNSTGDP